MNELVMQSYDFFSGASKPIGDIPHQQITKTLIHYNNLNNSSIRQIDSRWTEHIASLMPFSKIVAMQIKYGGCDPLLLANQFLRKAFAHLNHLDVSYEINYDPDEKGQDKVNKFVEISKKTNLSQQAYGIKREYERLRGLRRVFALMHEKHLLTGPDFAIPIEHLPETLLAEPIWFTTTIQQFEDEFNFKWDRWRRPMTDKELNTRHKLTNSMERLASLFPTTQQSDLYQIYNYRPKGFESFNALNEVMPISIMEVANEALKVFDYLIITTPYHDIANKMWGDFKIWPRHWDPEIIGIMEGKPFFIRLGRWSGTGFLVNKCDQIVDTIIHLDANLDAIISFVLKIQEGWMYWYRGQKDEYHPNVLPPKPKRPIKVVRGIINHCSPPEVKKQLNANKTGLFSSFIRQIIR